jgi:hypothetical protein
MCHGYSLKTTRAGLWDAVSMFFESHQQEDNNFIARCRLIIMNEQMRNFRTFLMHFINSEMPVCPDVLMRPVFQIISNEGQLLRVQVIVNICPALFKQFHHCCIIFDLIHHTFPIYCDKLMVHLNLMDILCTQKPNSSLHFKIDWTFYFLTHFQILQRIPKSENQCVVHVACCQKTIGSH